MLGLLYYKSVDPIMNGGGPGAAGQQPPEKREGGPSPPPKKRRIICSSVPSMVGMQKKRQYSCRKFKFCARISINCPEILEIRSINRKDAYCNKNIFVS